MTTETDSTAIYSVISHFQLRRWFCVLIHWWIQRYGRNLDAFWPVVDTEIGRLGIMMANEGSYPENARALAMNGAEVVYRASYPHPATGNEIFEIQSRARAQWDNWMKDLRTELYQMLYEQPIYPKKPLPQSRTNETRRIPREGHSEAD